MNSPYRFPVGISSPWLAPKLLPIPNENLRTWLLNSGSLTERLVARCTDFQLTILGQERISLTNDEFSQVCEPGQKFNEQDWLIREVILWGDGTPWVFARSIIPIRLWQQDFTDLNSQPLGQRIFNDVRFKRLPFQITKVGTNQLFSEKLNVSNKHDLWGRRSVFCFENLKMMVCEVFLPDSPAYTKIGTALDAK
ncbi:chorismate lyase [Paraglaciecola aquimarina]|uniref:Probable chorismate pyruvate-lyase n=1 Tax=Paraglaciecola algarum TaxID=3050085 RepID=A0ABS9DD79_9ALTE|nr:chorismate lyase [Paraglaciecola sp. G1-23]MCF2950310.1 chorismate lyase [Paraglaciecola sp. G1-23]